MSTISLHPSVEPLKNFHSAIQNTFSPLPQDGKILEVISRISLLIISPFAYIALAFLAVVGYPYTKTVRDCLEDATLSTPFSKGDDDYTNWKKHLSDLQHAASCCAYPKLAVFLATNPTTKKKIEENMLDKITVTTLHQACKLINQLPQKDQLTGNDLLALPVRVLRA
ncbi:MAG: hypothetical protein KR126chlam3_00353 [Chlamydiae bacterium]|nr:hypothetical protein [Chlamydiota bacterium]